MRRTALDVAQQDNSPSAKRPLKRLTSDNFRSCHYPDAFRRLGASFEAPDLADGLRCGGPPENLTFLKIYFAPREDGWRKGSILYATRPV
jgi:hypothetical protein